MTVETGSLPPDNLFQHRGRHPMSVIIREKNSKTLLADAREMGKDVVNHEGNLYFDPVAVMPAVLKVTEKTYTCPVKGTCHWVDYQGADGTTVPNVAWVYDAPKPGHEVIKGRFGFYSGSRGPTTQEG
jgi:uncharacterized protein (DUF427 family)